jgi:hypothetical protein
VRFSILHLSDLHRDLADELDTKTLLHSLERDVGRLGSALPPILRPSLCVITGDMIYGASPIAVAPNDEVSRQYAQTLDFLVGLAQRFFGGDRDRVVILPGNHDVFLPAVMASLERVDVPTDPHARARLVDDLSAPQSKLRWSWRELCFYRIVNEATYRSRLEHFANLYSTFYEGRRAFALDPEHQHDLFDFSELNFCILSLSSCFNNDPLRRAGAFHPAAVTEVCRRARDPVRAGRLIAAAWHHNLSGGPMQDDYVESDVLQIFIDSGISIALHGHRHITDCIDERCRVGPDSRKITIVSAGTLCAGPHHLAPGEPRSFNVIEIDTDAWSGRVHQRRMVNGTYSLPMWGPGHFNASNRSYLDFPVARPLEVRPSGLDLNLILEHAERLLGAQRWSEVVATLRLHHAVPLARPLLARALFELGDPRQTIDVLAPPTTIAEVVLIGGAVYEGGTPADAEAFLAVALVADGKDASVREIARRVRERMAQ